MKINKSNKLSILIGAILIAAAVVEFVFLGFQKEVWFIDEILTFETTNGFEQPWPDTNKDVWQTGNDIVDFMAANDSGIHYIDMSRYMTKYPDQLPFYYLIVRIACLICKGSASVWVGLFINLPIYVAFLALIYKLLLKYTDNNYVAVISGFFMCVFFNRLMLQQATMIRLYMLLLLEEVLLLIVAIRINCEGFKDKNYPKKLFVLNTILTIVGLLTTFDFWVYYAVCATAFCLVLIAKGIYNKCRFGERLLVGKSFKLVYGWCVSFAIAMSVTVVAFHYCIKNLLREQGARALGSLIHLSKERLKFIGDGYERSVSMILGGFQNVTLAIFVAFMVVITGAVILLFKNKKASFAVIMSLAVSQIYQCVICYTMPDGFEDRYFWGSTTIFMFLFYFSTVVIVVSIIRLIVRKPVKPLISVPVSVIVAIILVFKVCSYELTIIANGDGIAYLNDSGKNMEFLYDNSKTPWLVYGDIGGGYGYYDWTIPDNICFLSTDGNENAINAIMQYSDSESFVVYCFDFLEEEAEQTVEKVLNKNIEAELITRGGWLKVYNFKVKNAGM